MGFSLERDHVSKLVGEHFEHLKATLVGYAELFRLCVIADATLVQGQEEDGEKNGPRGGPAVEETIRCELSSPARIRSSALFFLTIGLNISNFALARVVLAVGLRLGTEVPFLSRKIYPILLH